MQLTKQFIFILIDFLNRIKPVINIFRRPEPDLGVLVKVLERRINGISRQIELRLEPIVNRHNSEGVFLCEFPYVFPKLRKWFRVA